MSVARRLTSLFLLAAALMVTPFGPPASGVAMPGNGLAPPDADPAVIRESLARVNPRRLEADVRRLASYPSRHSRSETNADAARWLLEQFRAAGYDAVAVHEFPLEPSTGRNVVCTKPGTTEPDKILLLGAHFDSRSRDLDDPDAPAPGADDNASGTAGLLELARVLREVETRWTIRFVAFSGEEQGLVGSTAYAKLAKAEALPIALMINLDMIGHPVDREHREVLIERDQGLRTSSNDVDSRRYAERMARAAREYTRLSPRPGPLYGTDYMPFEAEGFVCIGVFDGADKAPFYHTDEDTPDVVDADYAAEVVRLVLATVLDVAG